MIVLKRNGQYAQPIYPIVFATSLHGLSLHYWYRNVYPKLDPFEKEDDSQSSKLKVKYLVCRDYIVVVEEHVNFKILKSKVHHLTSIISNMALKL